MTGLSALTDASGLALLNTFVQSQASNATGQSASSSSSAYSGSLATGPSEDAVNTPGVNFVFSVSAGMIAKVMFDQPGYSVDQGAENLAASYSNYYDAVISEYSKSSAEISNEVYSGGIVDPMALNSVDAGMKDTLQEEIAGNEAVANSSSLTASMLTQWLAQGRPSGQFAIVGAYMCADAVDNYESKLSDAQVQAVITQDNNYAQSEHAMDAGIMKAFSNGTLQIQNALDVTGLDYEEASWNHVYGTGGIGSGGATWNSAALATSADGTQHTLQNFGGVMLYLSWNPKGAVPATTTQTSVSVATYTAVAEQSDA